MRRNFDTSILGVVAGAVLVTALGAQAQSDLDTGPLARLRALQARFATIDNVYMNASVMMWVRGRDELGTPGAEGPGRFEYWAAGDEYRYRTSLDPSLGLARDLDLAFDGLRVQLFDPATETLAIETRRPDSLPLAMPNPLFFAVDFLSRDTDRCTGCPLHLGMVADRATWDARLGEAKLGRRLGERIVHIPGGVLAGATFHYEVLLEDGLPARIDRYTEDGRIMTRVVLRDYREVDSGGGDTIPIPHTMVLAAADFRGDGGQVMYADVTIEALEVNQRMSANVFDLDFGAAATVWDGDQQRFTEHGTRTPATEAGAGRDDKNR